MSEFPKPSGYKSSWRDRAVVAVTNWIISTFATRAYQGFIITLISLGRAEFEKQLKARGQHGDS